MKIYNCEELKIILDKGVGFVYNDFGTHEKWNPTEYNKLHKASCTHLTKMTPGSADWTHYFDSFEEAILWLESNRKNDGYCMCKSCLKFYNNFKNLETKKEERKNNFKSINVDKIADILIKIYSDEKLPWSVNYFKEKGFTRESLRSDNKLFEFLILTCFDQYPRSMGQAWGTIRIELEMKNIFNIEKIKTLKYDDISKLLGDLGRYGNKDFVAAVKFISDKFYNYKKLIFYIKNSKDIDYLYFELQNIPTIGATISTKIIMYLFREIQIIKTDFNIFSVKMMRNLTKELHNSKTANILGDKTKNPNIVNDIIDILKEKGDPCAIDAMFLIDLNRKWYIFDNI